MVIQKHNSLNGSNQYCLVYYDGTFIKFQGQYNLKDQSDILINVSEKEIAM
jgi:hypothetical protein